MKIAISGATGLIGSTLVDHLRADGHTVARMVRRETDLGPDDILWSVDDQRLDPDDLVGTDAVVHIASEPIRSGNWTPEYRRELLSSRREGTRLVSQAMADVSGGPQVLLSASAVGWYGGARGDEVLSEESGPGDDFLAEVCQVWEDSAQPARDAGLRVTHFRTGVVLAEGGPLVDHVKWPFLFGLGGPVGSGRQWVPWVSLADQVRALAFLLDHDLDGPVNVCGPEPVINRRLTRALGAAWRRPTVLPVPLLAVRALYGEVGLELARASQRAIPARLLAAGFRFLHPSVEQASVVALA